ncbi:hypothetical protein EVAR_54408_1 [Eumeta japonica]|uniref:Uncharacterized protein n=1 Tax=Eumeta variegata TaxID=151549 RepID=A0A4C1Y7U3_EUMVA|nr:hypothetical protein EVAR_54408_1 [Eumeta japonica]
MPSPTIPKLLQKIVTELFPQQRQFDYPIAQDVSEDIPAVTEKELMDACKRVENNKVPGLDEIPNIALKTAIKAALTLFTKTYDTCLKEGYFPSREFGAWCFQAREYWQQVPPSLEYTQSKQLGLLNSTSEKN